jgi:hypothetical protein
MTDRLPHRPPLTQHDIEDQIIAIGDRLEALVEEYGDLAEGHAIAEAEFKREQARTLLAVIAHPPGGKKMTADERAARVELSVTDYRRDAAIAQARREAAREALNTHRTRLESYRTLAANVRYLTTDR